MSDMIKGLYYGTHYPFGEMHEQTAEREAAVKRFRAAEARFVEEHPDCKEAIDALLSEFSELDSYTSYEQFELGFRAGAQMVLEMLRPIK